MKAQRLIRRSFLLVSASFQPERMQLRDTMLKLIGSPNLEYKDLTAKVQDAA